MTTIIQYGVGNVGSIYNMCRYIGSKVRISGSLSEIEDSTSLILPGIGSFDHGMKLLEQSGIKEILQKKVMEQKTPILGICLGMQLMMQESEEGNLPGLGFIEGKCIKFKFGKDDYSHKIPHMGWTDVHPLDLQGLLFPFIDNEMRFYFAHSYHVVCRPDLIIATANYGYEFPAAIQDVNVIGVQFHPEKSHQFGDEFIEGIYNPLIIMTNPRVIPCLLLRGRGLVKTTKFKNPVYLGDPLNTINIFNKKMVDEIIILDIDVSRDSGKPKLDLLKRIASVCFSPLTYGGGVSNIKDAEDLFNIGIEKISLNTAAFENPPVISEMAKQFGNQSVVVSVNIGKDNKGRNCILDNSMKVIYNENSIVEQIKRFEDLGAGEILISDVARDGTMEGYDIGLISSITSNITVPVIACGGCGNYKHLKEVISEGGASAAAAGSIFVFNGPNKAVLISYPEHHLIKSIINE